MENPRLAKLKKYMEIKIRSIAIRDPLIFEMEREYLFGIDFSKDSDIFYGINPPNHFLGLITNDGFDKCNLVCRLLGWNKEDENELYTFRILKANIDEVVDFKEEEEYIKNANKYISK